MFCSLAFYWPPPDSLFLFTSWHFLGYEFSQYGVQCGHREMSCASENHTDHFKERVCGYIQLSTLPTLNKQSPAPLGSCWIQIQPSDQLPSQGSGCLCGLILAFLSRPVEIGLMKCSTLSESCLNIGCGIHLQLIPTEADHHTSAYTFLFPSHPLALFPLHCLPPFSPPSILDH